MYKRISEFYLEGAAAAVDGKVDCIRSSLLFTLCRKYHESLLFYEIVIPPPPRSCAKYPAKMTEVIVTVTNPPTTMDGNILLIRYPRSSGSSVSELQVFSVIIASQGKPYKAVRPFAKALQ